MPEFVIVKFKSNGHLDVVPHFWVVDDKIRWSKTATNYVKKYLAPKSSWTEENVNITCNNHIFENYADAVSQLNAMLENSDSENDQNFEVDEQASEQTNLTQRRVKKAKLMSDYDYDVGTASDSSCYLSNPPELHSLPPFGVVDESESLKNVIYVTSETSGVTCSHVEDFLQLKSEITPLREEVQNLRTEILGLRSEMGLIREMKTIMENFVLKSKREWESVKLAFANQPSQQENGVDLTVITSIFPVTTKDDFIVLESLVVENITEFDLVIKKIGGNTAKHHIQNALNDIFDIKFQKLCNWSGANAKLKMKSSAIISQMLDTINNICPPFTKEEGKGYVKFFFQHTFDRMKAQKKKTDMLAHVASP